MIRRTHSDVDGREGVSEMIADESFRLDVNIADLLYTSATPEGVGHFNRAVLILRTDGSIVRYERAD